jgi:hypothetical protein
MPAPSTATLIDLFGIFGLIIKMCWQSVARLRRAPVAGFRYGSRRPNGAAAEAGHQDYSEEKKKP